MKKEKPRRTPVYHEMLSALESQLHIAMNDLEHGRIITAYKRVREVHETISLLRQQTRPPSKKEKK